MVLSYKLNSAIDRLLEVADQRQHREHRLHQHAVLPLRALTPCEVGRIPRGGMEGGIAQDYHPLFKAPMSISMLALIPRTADSPALHRSWPRMAGERTSGLGWRDITAIYAMPSLAAPSLESSRATFAKLGSVSATPAMMVLSDWYNVSRNFVTSASASVGRDLLEVSIPDRLGPRRWHRRAPRCPRPGRTPREALQGPGPQLTARSRACLT